MQVSIMAKKLTQEEFISKAKQIHGGKYNYSKVKYINNRTKICIICPKHGEFWQNPHNHLKGAGCSYCTSNHNYNTTEFVEKAKLVHGNKYDYSKVQYKGNKCKICVICPKHGEFWQIAGEHLKGHGCSKCFYDKNKINNAYSILEFVEKAKKIHGNKYDYSKVNYINSRTKD